METYPRIAVWMLSLKIAVWVLGIMLLTGSGVLAAGLPSPLSQRVEEACARAHQAGLMGKVDQVDQEALFSLAGAPCPRVRAASIYALGEVKDERAVPMLIERLRDQDRGVRRVSARALGKIGDPAATEALISVLGDRQEAMPVRRVAAQALGRFSELRAAQALLRASQTESDPLKTTAIEALHGMRGFLELKAQLARAR